MTRIIQQDAADGSGATEANEIKSQLFADPLVVLCRYAYHFGGLCHNQ